MKRILIGVLIVFYIGIIDVCVNIIFQYPKDPQNINPSFLERYFEHGRSVEGKLRRMTGYSEADSAPRVRGGWLDSEKWLLLPKKPSNSEEVLIALYGMSHIKCLWEAIEKIDKNYIIRGFHAGGAPPNWSYCAYELDRGKHDADVVILGIISEGVSLVTSTSGMTAYFDLSYPYTFPRYYVRNNKLLVNYPPFYNVKGYMEYFYNKSKWNQYRIWLSKNDKYYDPLLFKRSCLDHSAIARLFRRAYAERVARKVNDDLYISGGFNEDSDEIVITRIIVESFAASARKDNIIPIIYIVNTQGQGDKLFRILKPVLDRNEIPYLSTHVIAPPDDPRVFLSENSHFTLEKDMELAKEMISIIKKEIQKRTL